MALVSSKLAAGMTILADHFNKLRDDLLSNHDHDGAEGAKVDHINLLEDQGGNMSGMGHRHQDIEYHLNGGGPGANNIDNPGGSQGVHGLAASAYVMGSIGLAFCLQAGTATLSSGSVNVSFTTPFSSVPIVVATYASARTYDPGNPTEASDIYITGRATSGFTIHSSDAQFDAAPVCWIAIGTKS